MPLVETAIGMIERDQLVVKDVVDETENARSVATEWYHNGALVRRDAHVMILRTQPIGGEQATF